MHAIGMHREEPFEARRKIKEIVEEYVAVNDDDADEDASFTDFLVNLFVDLRATFVPRSYPEIEPMD